MQVVLLYLVICGGIWLFVLYDIGIIVDHHSLNYLFPILIVYVIRSLCNFKTRRAPLLEQERLTLLEHLSSPPVFSGVRVTRSLVLSVCFVDRCLSFFFSPLCCLSSNLRILITPLVSSNSSYYCVIVYLDCGSVLLP